MSLENLPLNNTIIPRTLIFCCNAHASKNISKRFNNNECKKVFCKRTWDLLRKCDKYGTFKEILSSFRFLCYNKNFCKEMLQAGIVEVQPLNLVTNFSQEIYRLHCMESVICNSIAKCPKLEPVNMNTQNLPSLEPMRHVIYPFGSSSSVQFVIDELNKKISLLPWNLTCDITGSGKNMATSLNLDAETFQYLWKNYFQYVGFYSTMIHSYNRDQFTNNISENGNMQRRVCLLHDSCHSFSNFVCTANCRFETDFFADLVLNVAILFVFSLCLVLPRPNV